MDDNSNAPDSRYKIHRQDHTSDEFPDGASCPEYTGSQLNSRLRSKSRRPSCDCCTRNCCGTHIATCRCRRKVGMEGSSQRSTPCSHCSIRADSSTTAHQSPSCKVRDPHRTLSSKKHEALSSHVTARRLVHWRWIQWVSETSGSPLSDRFSSRTASSV